MQATAQQPKVHFVLNASGAGSVKQAFAEIGCAEPVIDFFDNLSWGPINPPDSALRQAWIEKWLGRMRDGFAQATDEFWAEAASPDILPVAWVCRHNAFEYTAFLEFIRRRGDLPFRVVDATGVECVRYNGQGSFVARSLGLLEPRQIVQARLLERQRNLKPEELAFYVAQWAGLRAENAPLRIMDDTRLVSAPLDVFDDAILSRVTNDWRKAVYAIGETMSMLLDEKGHHVSDFLLWARMRALGEAGALELRGDLSEMRGVFARRSSNAS